MRLRYLIILIFALPVAYAQFAGTWETHSDCSYSNCIQAFDDRVFVGTSGGIVVHNPGEDEPEINTNLNGLGGLDIVGLAINDSVLFYAAKNGALGRLDSDEWLTYSGLINDNINCYDLISVREKLYVATSQGISKLNPLDGNEALEIAENYTKLGGFDRNIAVNCITSDDSLIWAGCESGIAYSKLDRALFIPDNWDTIATNREVTAIMADSGGVWFSMQAASGEPSVFWTDGEIIDTVHDDYMNDREIDGFFYYDNFLYAHGHSGLFLYIWFDNFNRVFVQDHFSAHGGTILNDTLYVALEIGYGPLVGDTVRPVNPNSPSGNGFSDISFSSDGSVWVVASWRGLCRYKDGIWENYNYNTIESTDSVKEIIRLGIGSAYTVTVDGSDNVWIGTNGNGVFKLSADGEWEVFNQTNSFLRGTLEGGATQVVSRALIYDEIHDMLWVTNFNATNAISAAGMSVYPDFTSPDILYYSGTSTIPTNNIHGIDYSSNSLWLVDQDNGVSIINFGYDIYDTSDDYVYTYSSQLPSSQANQVAVDTSGNGWIATDGGVAVIDPDLGLVIAQDLPSNVSTSASDIAVDNWNNLWVTTNDGAAMFRSSDSSWHAIKSRYSSGTSAVERTDLANEILYSVGVNPINGDVWFCGEGAISVFHPGFSNPDAGISDLSFAPNPFVWNGIADRNLKISGVPPDADVYIYSSDGVLVRTINISDRGISADALWNGRNDSGEPVASGIYLVVAPSSAGIAKGKFALIRGDQ